MSLNETFCLPANPDVSGLGVRAAIYIQNFLSFIPAFYAISDGKVTVEELYSIEVQSSTILITALAILISAIVEGLTNKLSNVHAAIILNLSWMNNTNLFIYLLLYLHRTATNSGDVIPGWRFWWHAMWKLLGRARDDTTVETGKSSKPERGWRWTEWLTEVFHGTKSRRNLEHKLPDTFVLLLGILHLSLMGGVGLWLWSNPLRFDSAWRAQCHVPPSVVVLGHPIPITSKILQGFSILMYSLVLTPLFNTFIPMALVILFYTHFNRTYSESPPPTNTLFGKVVALFSFQSPFGNQGPTNYKIFPISVCLFLLAIINIVFVVDTEVTLHQNQHLQEAGESDWTFGQTLALLLLLIPLRDVLETFVKHHEGKVQDRIEAAHHATSALKEALQSGDLSTIQNLIEDGANIDWQNEDGTSLLHWAAIKNHVNLVIHLQAKGAQLDLKDKQGRTSIWWAAHHGHSSIVKFLGDKGAALDLQDEEGSTALLTAAENDRFDIVKYLGETGAHLDLQDKEKTTALMSAAKIGQDEVVRYLADKGAHLDLQDEQGKTALSLAALHCKFSIVKYLGNKGAHLNLQDKYGRTALMCVIQYGQLDVIKYLGDKGTHINLWDKGQGSALIYAAESGYVDIVKYLGDKGAHLNWKDKEGRTALLHAAQWGYLNIVKYLGDKGAHLDLSDNTRSTALLRAVQYGRFDVVKYLGDKEAHLDLQDITGNTPLFEAVVRGVVDMVKYLGDKGAQLDLQGMCSTLK